MKIIIVVGARPNFMKVVPLMRAFEAWQEFDTYLVHTGQHYDESMSELFFRQLDIPEPDVNLDVGSGTHAQQTADIMKKISNTLSEVIADYKDSKRLLQNSDEMLHFDKNIDGTKKLDGKKVIEAVVETFLFTSSFSYLLTSGELSGVGLLVEGGQEEAESHSIVLARYAAPKASRWDVAPRDQGVYTLGRDAEQPEPGK